MKFRVVTEEGREYDVEADKMSIQGAGVAVVFTRADDQDEDQIVAVYRKVDHVFDGRFVVLIKQKPRWFW